MTQVTPDVAGLLSILEEVEHLKAHLPQVIEPFSTLSVAALQEGPLSQKTKLLMALLVSIMQHSQTCIQFHLYDLMRHDLTHAELLDVVAMATYMGGGPALMSAHYALTLFEKHSTKDSSE